MTRLVVDASVTVKWRLPDRAGEADSERALALLSGIYHAVALEMEGTSPVTADEHDHRKARARGSFILLDSFSPAGGKTGGPEEA